MGKLVVYTGGMRSGKSDALISQAEKLQIAGVPHVVIKHELDNERVVNSRDKSYIMSRSGRKIECISVSTVSEFEEAVEEYANILIDEVQFFDIELWLMVSYMLRRHGKNIWVSGLDLDFRGVPFYNTSKLCALADEVVKLKSVCSDCGSLDGKFSYLEGAFVSNYPKDDNIKVGDQEYKSLCSKCYYEKVNAEIQDRLDKEDTDGV